MRSLRDRSVFVTGAASGIGRAVAEAAAREGAVLHLTDLQGDLLAEVADRIRLDGERCRSPARRTCPTTTRCGRWRPT
jgi:NAD(P)-dependent dehydrogenase (short-subunit alcohol dehydrogenase family)